MSKPLTGKVALVTGGSRGLGAATVRLLAEQGADVAFTYVSSEKRAQAVVDEVRGKGAKAVAFKSDQADTSRAPALIDEVVAHFGGLDILVNNAAIMHHLDLTTHSLDRLDAIDAEVAINVTAPLQLAVAMLPLLRTHRSAAVVNVTSGLAIAPKREAAVYCATKAALRSFTRSLRDQCRASGLPIQVSEAVMTLVDTTLSRPGAVRKYPPARAAADLIAGVERGQDEIWIEKTKLLRVVHRLSPGLAYRIMRDR